MNGISPLPTSVLLKATDDESNHNLDDQASDTDNNDLKNHVNIGVLNHHDTELGKFGIKRPSQEDCVEAPDLKKTNLETMNGDNGHQMYSSTLSNMIAPDLENVFTDTNNGPAALGALGQGHIFPATITEQVLVPDAMVGLIIGRGGEQITRLQSESKCKIQMAPQEYPTQQNRLCTLTGSHDAIIVAKSLIEKVIANENDKAAARANGGTPDNVNPGGMYEMMIPGNLVARIIGKGGEVIKSLQEDTGAKIVIIQDSREFALEKPLRITGSVEVVEIARQKVEQVLATEQIKLNGIKKSWTGTLSSVTNNNNISSCYDVTPSAEITEVISIPSSKVGLVMGKGGETIRQICMASGAHCQVDKNAPDGAREKNIVIKGKPDNVMRAKMLVSEKVGDVYDRGYGNVGGQYHQYPGNHIGSSVGHAPGTGQTDYSQQWAEYYRSLGMIKEAEIIEQQMVSRTKIGLTPSPQQQPDYSAQWAEYYRSLGKIKEAEAIESQMKMKGVETGMAQMYATGRSPYY